MIADVLHWAPSAAASASSFAPGFQHRYSNGFLQRSSKILQIAQFFPELVSLVFDAAGVLPRWHSLVPPLTRAHSLLCHHCGVPVPRAINRNTRVPNLCFNDNSPDEHRITMTIIMMCQCLVRGALCCADGNEEQRDRLPLRGDTPATVNTDRVWPSHIGNMFNPFQLCQM